MCRLPGAPRLHAAHSPDACTGLPLRHAPCIPAAASLACIHARWSALPPLSVIPAAHAPPLPCRPLTMRALLCLALFALLAAPALAFGGPKPKPPKPFKVSGAGEAVLGAGRRCTLPCALPPGLSGTPVTHLTSIWCPLPVPHIACLPRLHAMPAWACHAGSQEADPAPLPRAGPTPLPRLYQTSAFPLSTVPTPACSVCRQQGHQLCGQEGDVHP